MWNAESDRQRSKISVTVLGAVVVLAVAWAASQSPLAHRSVARIPADPFTHVYVQSKVGSADKCLVTDRAGATVRRSEPNLAGTRWKCHWSDGPDGPVLTALTGKEPSYIFVPAAGVTDPVLPLLYERLRAAERWPLPRVRWVQLFRDRQYRGLYLQIRVPDKKWMEKTGRGRGEILQIRDSTAQCWNRKLRPECKLWNESFIAESIFPEPASTPGLALLDRLATEGGFELRGFVLSEKVGAVPVEDEGAEPPAWDSPSLLWPWPLPVDLGRQLGASAAVYTDERYGGWRRLGPAAEFADLPPALPPWDRADRISELFLSAVSSPADKKVIGERLTHSPTLRFLNSEVP